MIITELIWALFINDSMGIKSLEDVPELYMTSYTRRKRQSYIDNTYVEYQKFMKVDMPEYNLHFRPRRGLEWASVNYKNDEGFNLYVSDKACKARHKKELLFHEFTHLYDLDYLDKTYSYKKVGKAALRNTHVYTEIHAEQVRFLYMLRCKTVTDVPINITYNTEIYNISGRKVGFYDYLSRYKSEIIRNYVTKMKRRTNKILKEEFFINLELNVAYYIGALSVYRKYCDYRVDELMDLNEFAQFWNTDINSLIEFYCSHDLYKPTMKTLPKIEIHDMADILSCNLVRGAREKGFEVKI